MSGSLLVRDVARTLVLVGLEDAMADGALDLHVGPPGDDSAVYDGRSSSGRKNRVTPGSPPHPSSVSDCLTEMLVTSNRP